MEFLKLHLKEFYPVLGQEGRDPTVEIYRPTGLTDWGAAEPKRPCLVLCPGGGYGFVSRREAEPIALNFLPEGFNIFVLTYSVKPHHFPAQLTEVAGLVELIYEKAEEWNCDTSRIAIMGFSAGGHLAAHYSTSYDCPEVRAVFPESKPVQATVLSYPVITTELAYSHLGSVQGVSGHEEPTKEDEAFFSCERRVTEHTPPAFLWTTAEDGLVPAVNTLRYATALAEHGVNFELHIYPHGRHGLATVDSLTCDTIEPGGQKAHGWIGAARTWLREQFA